MIIRARCILPLEGGPIENAALVFEEGKVKWIGPWRSLEVPPCKKLLDLGEVVLMPGLVNAHCHLDYTRMAGLIPPPKTFPDWIKAILQLKAGWDERDFVQSWQEGARMLLDSGTTTVADTESMPEILEECWETTPLRMVSFLEMTGVKNRRETLEILEESLGWMEKLPAKLGKEIGLSPHAFYSTTPDLMRKSAAVARGRALLLSTHLAESESEFRMFADGTGPFASWLADVRDMSDCGTGSPVRLASEYGLLSRALLAIHVNYLAAGDAELLGQSGATVVHCPRSHDYFGHDPFPYEALRKTGVNICLATDSLASARKLAGEDCELNLWDEMRLFSKNRPGVSPMEILRMVTTRPAAALNKSGEVGTLRMGAWGDCIAVAYSGPVAEARLIEEILYSTGLREVFIAGELVKNA